MRFRVWQYIAACCSELCCSVLCVYRHPFQQSGLLQCVAVCRVAVRRVTLCCIRSGILFGDPVCRRVLQCVVLQCIVLQCVVFIQVSFSAIQYHERECASVVTPNAPSQSAICFFFKWGHELCVQSQSRINIALQ